MEIFRRGKSKVWYARVSYRGQRIEDCLKTCDRDEAQKRLIELKLMVDAGEYKRWKQTFAQAAAKYKPGIRYSEITMRVHLLPRFGDMKMCEIDADAWAHEVAAKYPESTAKKQHQVMREMGFKLPKVKYRQGKVFDRSQILTEADIRAMLECLNPRYHPLVWVAAYSTLRLKNVVELRRQDVDFKAGWIRVIQSKKHTPVEVPIAGKLRAVFAAHAIKPLRPEDRFFPGVEAAKVTKAVTRAFNRTDTSWATFHHLRHHAACILINAGVKLEVIQQIMGHKDIRSTQVYARVTSETMEQAMRVFDNG